MVVAETQSLIILPALGMGLIIGTLEMIFIHGDEAFRGSHWLSHGLTHIFPVLIVALLISMNVDYFLTQWGSSLPTWLQSGIAIRVVIGLIVTIKVFTGSAVVAGARGRGMHESLMHCLVIGGLVVAAPFVWPMIAPMMPAWLGGGAG
jgi:hypothetical protein